MRPLFTQGFTISGARNRLDELVSEPSKPGRGPRSNLAAVRKEIRNLIELLRT